MKIAAQIAVARVSRLPAPRPPKTCWVAPPPNAAPMPPPLPCCRSTTSIRKQQTKMWMMSSSVTSMASLRGGERFGRQHDRTERRLVQACPTDEGSIDVWLGEQDAGVVRF